MGENFHEFRESQAVRENFIRECLVLVDKDGLMALIRENIIRKMLSIWCIRENFLPRKFPAIWYCMVSGHFLCSLRIAPEANLPLSTAWLQYQLRGKGLVASVSKVVPMECKEAGPRSS